MKPFYLLTIIILLLLISCSKKNYTLHQNRQNLNSISLDAQQNSGVHNTVRTILKSKLYRNVFLDGKNYKLHQFKSIIDTISNGYSLKRVSSDSIKIIRTH